MRVRLAGVLSSAALAAALIGTVPTSAHAQRGSHGGFHSRSYSPRAYEPRMPRNYEPRPSRSYEPRSGIPRSESRSLGLEPPALRLRLEEPRRETPRLRTRAPRVPRARSYSPPSGERDSRGRIKRSAAAKDEFMRESGHPHGWPGHVVDHIVPLACGGGDIPSNMQWQTTAEGKAKDKLERRGCSR